MAKKLKTRFFLDVKGIRAAVQEASLEPKMQMAMEVEREAKTSMEGGAVRVASNTAHTFYVKTGRRKDRARAKVVRVPSKPGTPPHVQTGVGRSSIRTAWIQSERTAIVGPSSPPAPYMGVHEFGSKNHPPRPFMRPALQRVIPRYPKLYKNLPLGTTKSGRRVARKAKAFGKKHGGK